MLLYIDILRDSHIVCSPVMRQGWEFCIIVLMFAAVAKLLVTFPEILDFSHVKPFLTESLMFSNYARKHDDIFEELDKHQVREIYEEVTGQPFPKFEVKKKEIPHTDPDRAMKELEQLRAQGIRSVHLQTELASLKAGQIVDITDSWKLNCLKRKPHPLCDQISDVKIDSVQKALSFRIDYPEISLERLRDSVFIFQLKQDLYDALQAIDTEEWMKPYAPFYERMKLSCFATEVDDFGNWHPYRFMNLEIEVAELRKRVGKFFNVGELNQIARLEFNDGAKI